MKHNYDKEIRDALFKANGELGTIDKKVTLVLVGGALLVLQKTLPRSSADVDYINKLEQDSSVINILELNEINNRVKTFENTYGEWDKDIKEIEKDVYENIRLFVVSLERQAASRLFSEKRFDDVLEISKIPEFKKKKFEECVTEIYGYCDPIFMKEFIENKDAVESLYKERGWNYESSNIKKLYEKKSR